MPTRKRRALSPLENDVMGVVWSRNRATADEVRQALAEVRVLKDSTVRTVLRRLEEKGYVRHSAEGRTYVYEPKVDALGAAADAVRGIIDRFCQGSVETLLTGMVDGEILPAEKLKALAEKISAAEAGGGAARSPAVRSEYPAPTAGQASSGTRASKSNKGTSR